MIKLERFPDGDISRQALSPKAKVRSLMFLQHNAGKKGMCVDLKHEEERDIVLALVTKVDVIIEAFTPGVMQRLGLGFDDLRAHNPGLILCSISGFWQSGLHTLRPDYAYISRAMTGWLGMQFLHRDPPKEVPRGPEVLPSGISRRG